MDKVLVEFVFDDTPFKAGKLYEVTPAEAEKFVRQGIAVIVDEFEILEEEA